MYPAANPVDGVVTDPAMSLRGACWGDGQYGARAYLWLDMRALMEYLGGAAMWTDRVHLVASPGDPQLR